LSDAILDIGTGSGCIACTLAAELPHARVTAWDVSDAALAIARKNARRLGVKVRFEKTDILSGGMSLAAHQKDSLFSCIVSNPPYICQKEAADMERQVLDYEPSLALFVPDDDPLLFYGAIADFAVGALRPQGCLFFEINPLYARQIEAMLHAVGFTSIETRRDQFGRERFTKAIKI
jgi:release factor glutamine methyltransferase